MDPHFHFDAFDTALGGLRPHGAFVFRSEMAAPWGLATETKLATFHYVESEHCLLTVTDPIEGTPTVTLESGDVGLPPLPISRCFFSHNNGIKRSFR